MLAGEVSDFIDSRQRDTGLRAASRGPGLLTLEVKGSQEVVQVEENEALDTKIK